METIQSLTSTSWASLGAGSYACKGSVSDCHSEVMKFTLEEQMAELYAILAIERLEILIA